MRVENDPRLDSGDRDGRGLRSIGAAAAIATPRLEKYPAGAGATPTGLLALPVRRALVEERVHSFAEILAHIGAQDQVLAFVARQRPADAAYRFLGDFERDRRMAGNELRRFIGAALQ